MPLCPECEHAFVPLTNLDSTNIHDQLRSEAGPASVQPDEIDAILKNVVRDLDSYEAEIIRLETRKMFLVSQKERLIAYAVQVQSLLSPVRKLPSEILQRVFDMCCDTNRFKVANMKSRSTYVDSSALIRTKPAMAISSVSSLWRKNALSMRNIWSRITLDWTWELKVEFDERDHQRTLSTLANFLDRSLQQPLSLVVDIPTLEETTLWSQHPIFTLLKNEAHRWGSLLIQSPNSLSITNLFPGNLSLLRFPLLNRVAIMTARICDASDLDIFTTDIAPSLSSLQLQCSIPDGLTHFPFAQISHLEFRADDVDIERLFLCFPNLVSLATEDGYNVQQSVQTLNPTSPRSCLTIKTLTLRHGSDLKKYPGICRRSTLPFFTFPSLRTIYLIPSEVKLHSKLETGWHNFDLFLAFVKRSSFPLTTLSVDSLAISDSSLVRLLVHLPTLQHLTFDDTKTAAEDSPLTSQFIESLHAYRSSPLRPHTVPMVPRLCSLKLNVGASAFKDVSVVQMVQSRWTPSWVSKGASLQQKDVYKPLEYVEKNGMRAVVLWKDQGV
ncbi:hypothetical protein BDP27DRAFT_1312293 [Rhodocollybia butyracea]|uniref:F-box domain-containing protein n=1 Tax=Rhodocollybia butyracea TaxID=206335 RepID=A0A9P5UGE3_9AGAR|nr:hypothetical protein BDP27DRAFT_1312293 [Rhodocollybia butyracea]